MKLGHTSGLLMSAALGASAMYLLDPQAGRRRRAVMGQKLSRLGNLTEDAIGTTSRDATNRARGVVAEISAWFRPEQPDDRVLRERVRSALGFLVDHPSSIGVVATNGRITLSGPVLAREVDRLLDEVRRVPGVREVVSHLDIHREPGDVSGLQGGPSRRRRGARMEWMQENWSPTARLLTGVGAAGLLVYGARLGMVPGALFALAGAGLLARSATNLDFRRLTGVGAGRRAVEVTKTIRIAAPIEKVFDFWTDFERYPPVLSTVRSVRRSKDGHWHWEIEGPAGLPIQWDLRVVCEDRPHRLAWRTEPGSTVQHGGSVQFQTDRDGMTTVHVSMSYNPAAGWVGHGAAKLVGYDLKSVLDEELMRMKSAIETGKPLPVSR